MKSFPPLMALEKARKYCAYQERCQQEVRNKLREWGLDKEVIESHLSQLVSENYLDEQRFASSFARGKFRMKHWGRKKITAELQLRAISPNCIRTALKEIRDEEYGKVIRIEVLKAGKRIKEKNPAILRLKVCKYLYSRGFELDLVHRILKADNE